MSHQRQVLTCVCGHVNYLHAGFTGDCAGFVHKDVPASCGCDRFRLPAQGEKQETGPIKSAWEQACEEKTA